MSGQLPPPPSFPPSGPPQGPPPGWGPPPGQRPPSRNRGLLIGGAVGAAALLVLVIVIVAIAVSGGDDDPVANDPDTTETTASETTEATEAATTTDEPSVATEPVPVETPTDLPTEQVSTVPAEDLAFTFPDSFRDLPLDVAESDQQVDRTRVGSTVYYDREDGSDLSFIWYPDNTLADYRTYQGPDGEKPTDKVGSGRCHPDLFGASCVIELAGGVLTVADSSPDVELTAEDAIAMLEEMAALIE